MDLLGGYGSDEDMAPKQETKRPLGASSFMPTVDSAPVVTYEAAHQDYVHPDMRTVFYNPTAESMWRPLAGPRNPRALNDVASAQGKPKNAVLGYVEKTTIDSAIFDEQYNTYTTYGYAENPTERHIADKGFVGDKSKAVALGGRTVYSAPGGSKQPAAAAAGAGAGAGSGSGSGSGEGEGGAAAAVAEGEESKTDEKALVEAEPEPETKESKRAYSRKRKADFGDASNIDTYLGPWAPHKKHELMLERLKKEAAERPPEPALDEEELKKIQQNALAETEERIEQAGELQSLLGGRGPKRQKTEHEGKEKKHNESSEFHGDMERDYQGRSWLEASSSVPTAVPDKCFAPKKHIHTWSGHAKGVNAIRFFPGSGHLLLSASMDHTVKIWDVYGTKKCIRTYEGHEQAVREANFSADGKHFVTCSYDRYIKFWDTETGQVVSRHTTGKIPFTAVMHPDKDKSYQMLSGMSNKRIVQWDLREGGRTVVQYDEHLGPVNSILFIDNNRKFVSTSDDKKLFVWEYGIPVVIKHIGEPDSQAIPRLAAHPSGKYFIGQSMDNQILVFDSFNRVKVNRKKHFAGHLNAGYAAGLGFSPDGNIVVSGDAEGRCFFWSWKKGIIWKKLKCHDQVTIDVQWNPHEPSRVATCSWDGLIKYWD